MTADIFRELRHGREKLREFEEVFGTGPHSHGVTKCVYETLRRLLGELAEAGIEYNSNYTGSQDVIEREFMRKSLAYERANDLAKLYNFIVTPANWGEENRILAKPTYLTI